MAARLKTAIRALLFLAAATPLVVTPAFPFPYTSSKAFFFRAVVEIALLLFAVFLLRFGLAGLSKNLPGGLTRILRLARSRFGGALLFFLLSSILSTIFAVDGFHAVWGNAERGEGLVSLLHYFIFLGLTLLFFDKSDWRKFIKLSVILSIPVAAAAWLQYAGAGWLRDFPFYIGPTDRPGSALENPGFLSTYLIFIAGFSGWLLFKERGWARAVFGSALLLSITAIFLTGSRGALIGFGAGLLLFLAVLALSRSAPAPPYRRLFRALLSALVALGLLFVFTRHFSFWQGIPGLNRLAGVTLNDSSLQTRALALGSSFRAFLDRPIFGWGLENYNVAYNKHYDPAYARFEEAWFDRAHNKVMDIAVMQGSLGIVSYAALLSAFAFLIVRAFPALPERSLFLSLVAAYFVQNLVLFDTPVSYLFLFGFFGFVFANHREDSQSSAPKAATPRALRLKDGIFKIGGAAAILGLLFSLYYLHYVPYRQAKLYRALSQSGAAEKIIAALNEFSTPYTYLQPAIRLQFIQLVTNAGALRDPRFAPVVRPAIAAFREVSEREAEYEPRNFVFLGQVYLELGRDDPKFFAEAEKALRRALVLAPKRQDVYYLLAFSLAGQGRFGEAVGLARTSLGFDERVAKAHYNLGLELVLSGREHWNEALEEFGKALDIGFINRDLVFGDFANMATALEKMLNTYVLERDSARSIEAARRLGQVSPEFARDMETLIGLVEAGDWEAVFRSFGKGS